MTSTKSIHPLTIQSVVTLTAVEPKDERVVGRLEVGRGRVRSGVPVEEIAAVAGVHSEIAGILAEGQRRRQPRQRGDAVGRSVAEVKLRRRRSADERRGKGKHSGARRKPHGGAH